MSLAPNIIKYPTADEKEETAFYYRNEKEFPGVIGISLFHYLINIYSSIDISINFISFRLIYAILNLF